MIEEARAKIYSIPDNFVDESRIINGMFRTRYLIEGLIMAAIIGIPALMIPAKTINAKIMIVVGFSVPFFLLGVNGFNGDPISVLLKSWHNWRKERTIMLYNNESKALKKSPLADMMEQTPAGDKILDLVDAFNERKRERAARFQYIEGQTFEFAPDSELTHLYADEVESIVSEDYIFTPDEEQEETGWNVKQADYTSTFVPTEIEIAVPNDHDVPFFTHGGKRAKKIPPVITVDNGTADNPFAKGGSDQQ